MANNQTGYDPNWYPRNNNWQGPSTPQMNGYWGYGNPQVPQVQQPVQVTVAAIPGKVIQDLKEIRPNDVPMDGSKAYYPMADGKWIIVKRWTANGTIAEDRYALVQPEEENTEGNAQSSQNGSQYQQILDELDAIKKALYRKQPYHKRNFNQNKMKPEDKNNGE